MKKQEVINNIKKHWVSYIASGGFNKPSSRVGRLDSVGLNHWTLFLQLGRKFVTEYPDDIYLLHAFIPAKTMRLLVGD